jgi:hypothetical protein
MRREALYKPGDWEREAGSCRNISTVDMASVRTSKTRARISIPNGVLNMKLNRPYFECI